MESVNRKCSWFGPLAIHLLSAHLDKNTILRPFNQLWLIASNYLGRAVFIFKVYVVFFLFLFSFPVIYDRRYSSVWLLMFKYLSSKVNFGKVFIVTWTKNIYEVFKLNSIISFFSMPWELHQIYTYPRFWKLIYVCLVIF